VIATSGSACRNTMQHPATPCNTLQHMNRSSGRATLLQHPATHCNTSHPTRKKGDLGELAVTARSNRAWPCSTRLFENSASASSRFSGVSSRSCAIVAASSKALLQPCAHPRIIYFSCSSWVIVAAVGTLLQQLGDCCSASSRISGVSLNTRGRCCAQGRCCSPKRRCNNLGCCCRPGHCQKHKCQILLPLVWTVLQWTLQHSPHKWRFVFWQWSQQHSPHKWQIFVAANIQDNCATFCETQKNKILLQGVEGVAVFRQNAKMIGLFCKRAL